MRWPIDPRAGRRGAGGRPGGGRRASRTTAWSSIRKDATDARPVSALARRAPPRDRSLTRTLRYARSSMRVLVISDIHANLPALDAVLAAAGEVDAVWHLGDVVGYGPDPDGVVARLREIGARGRPRQPRRGRDRRRRDRLVQPRGPPGDGVDPRRDRPGTDGRLAPGAAADAGHRGLHAGPRQPARPAVGVHPHRRRRAREPRGADDHATASTATRTCRSSGRADGGRVEAAASRRGPIRGPRATAAAPQPGQRRPAARRRSRRSSYLILDTGAADGDVAAGRLRHRGRPGAHARRRACRRRLIERLTFGILDRPSRRRPGRMAYRRRAVASTRAGRSPCTHEESPHPMIGGRRPLSGRKPGDRRIRVERPHSPYFRYTGPGQLTAKRAASAPTTAAGPRLGAPEVGRDRPADGHPRRRPASACRRRRRSRSSARTRSARRRTRPRRSSSRSS